MTSKELFKNGWRRSPVVSLSYTKRASGELMVSIVGCCITKSGGATNMENYQTVWIVDVRLYDVKAAEETAEALSLTVAAVKSRLHRARLFLRQQLENRFGKSANSIQSSSV